MCPANCWWYAAPTTCGSATTPANCSNAASPNACCSPATPGTGRAIWVEPEAELFARHARARGVSDSLIVIEPRATNFAENIAFARELFPDLRRATFVTKPNSIRRVALTLPVRWPGLEGHVDAPDYAFPDGISNLVGVLGVIDEMVGDLDRIMRYPALGFQVACPIPAQVMDAWERLVARGFDRHLVNPPR